MFVKSTCFKQVCQLLLSLIVDKVRKVNCFHKEKQRVFLPLQQETHAELCYLARWFNLSRQISQPIVSYVVTDACQNNLAKLFSRHSPRGSFETKPCMLVNVADKLQNTSQFFHRFTIPPDPLDAQIPRPGPYLFHSVGMQNQFPHYGQAAVLPYQVPMPHASPSTSSVPSSESENTSEENPRPGATNRNCGSNWTDAETRYLLELWRDNFPSARKETALCWMSSQRSSIPFLKTREYQATSLVRSVRRALNTFRTSTNE